MCWDGVHQCGDMHRFIFPSVKAQFYARNGSMCLQRDHSLIGNEIQVKGRKIITIHDLEFKMVFTVRDLEKNRITIRANSEKGH